MTCFATIALSIEGRAGASPIRRIATGRLAWRSVSVSLPGRGGRTQTPIHRKQRHIEYPLKSSPDPPRKAVASQKLFLLCRQFSLLPGQAWNKRKARMIPVTRLGMLTPSSNTVLEPMSDRILSELTDVSLHFARFRVQEISMTDTAIQQFDRSAILAAATLLADAKVDCIAWNGTSAGWLGFDSDRRLCEEIEAHTGIPATTSVLALNEAFELTKVRRFALVTPYLDEIQNRIIENFRQAGYDCVAERHLNDRGNFSFADYTELQIEELARQVTEAKPDAIVIFCTNFRGAPIADKLEKTHGIPIYDTVSTAIWRSLLISNADAARVKGWGSLFSLPGSVEDDDVA